MKLNQINLVLGIIAGFMWLPAIIVYGNTPLTMIDKMVFGSTMIYFILGSIYVGSEI
ncbi:MULTISPECIES: hypothetical protein [Methanobacterium]|uniref:hypothetical protein n=1 Tax=Methanobacterium TaxID=2160 RepID=UPI0015B41ECC|nr:MULTISPECIES: hypothetical protein [Methanobacterium]